MHCLPAFGPLELILPEVAPHVDMVVCSSVTTSLDVAPMCGEVIHLVHENFN